MNPVVGNRFPVLHRQKANVRQGTTLTRENKLYTRENKIDQGVLRKIPQ